MLALDGRELEIAFSIRYPPGLQERGITVVATADIPTAAGPRSGGAEPRPRSLMPPGFRRSAN